ncbi:MDR family MFS transporter [Lactobacillus sp. YT155]|uniref:MDR family MFS transporter n=1 Tax=Lactobacillus sp. YT155 TaxID=3060955 RepID=UPI00265FBA3A|nr:MDR family MFS transporter [Lactobacillus sp. YT155]MDO1604480.1 MDR family MFS transporter [Lactobacillus sp. YT155]
MASLNQKTNNSHLIMVAIFIATFMTSIEATIVTTALPTIISDLNGLSMQSWVFATYLLTSAISTPVYGKLADTVGRKPIFIIGTSLFLLGSFLCGIAGNIEALIVFRAIQGLGAGAIMPVTFTIIADLFSYEKRSNKIAFNNTAWGISALFGPIVGGFIVEKLNWHWIFFINLPLGLIVLLIIGYMYHETEFQKKKLNIDYLGIIFLSISLVSLLLLFQDLSNPQLAMSKLITLVIIIIVSSILFLVVERKVKDPVIPLKLFRNSTFSIQIVTALILSGVQMGYQIYFPIWLQSVYSFSPSMAGLAITPSSIMWLVGSFFVGWLIKRYAPKRIIMPLVLIETIIFLPLVFATRQLPEATFYLIATINGLVMGIVITTTTVISQHLVPKDYLGTASSMFTLGRTLGQTIMTGVFGLIFNLATQSQLKNFNNISLTQITNEISSVTKSSLGKNVGQEIQYIIINNMHSIYLVVVILFILVFVINYFDKQKTVVE